MVFRWAPTNARKFGTRQLDTLLCPLCKYEEETVNHMVRCPLATAEKARKDVFTNLELSLDEMGMHLDLTSLISLVIGSGETPLCEVTESDIGLQDIMNAQHDIGWGILQYGFVAKA